MIYNANYHEFQHCKYWGGGIKCLWVALQFGALSRGLISPWCKDAASLKMLHWAITFNDIFKIT